VHVGNDAKDIILSFFAKQQIFLLSSMVAVRLLEILHLQANVLLLSAA